MVKKIIMKTDKLSPITTLFLDIGGVLLSNGWGHESRSLAAKEFNLDINEIEERHHLTMTTYEEGKLTIDAYLKLVIFYEKRGFTFNQFQKFMFEQTTPDQQMISFIKHLKAKYQLKIAVVNNEGRELNEFRIRKFQLDQFVDFFISSCFVHFRKPDVDIFRIALDIAQVPADKVVYIEDMPMFVYVARSLGIRSIRHKSYSTTSEESAAMGLKI
jgi:putative hydrolase of the HAD superfamily